VNLGHRASSAACIHVDVPNAPYISAVGRELQQACLLVLEPRLLGGTNLVQSDLDRQEHSGTTLEHVQKSCLAHFIVDLHRTGPGAQLSSLATWHQEQSLQEPQAVMNKHKQQTDRNVSWLLTAGAAAAGVAAAGVGLEAHCESSSYAVEQMTDSRWSKLLKRIDPRQLLHAQEQNAFLEEMQADPKVSYCYMSLALEPHCDQRHLKRSMHRLAFFSLSLHLQVAVVLALALPFLSLSFGYVPAKHELDVAAQLVQANADELDGWEIGSLVWAAARLGYRPADHVMETLLQQVPTVFIFVMQLLNC
jgi:hypothetical protein